MTVNFTSFYTPYVPSNRRIYPIISTNNSSTGNVQLHTQVPY